MSTSSAQFGIESILYSPHLESGNPLHKILEPMLDGLTVSKPATDIPRILWPAERYRLDRSSVFRRLSVEKQDAALVALSELTLSLSYYIEKSGHLYGAKMIAQSETIEEKSLYALFTAEEAIHLREFRNFMNFIPNRERHQHPLLDVLAETIEHADRNALVFVIQVLLEGFGIAHYSGLRDDSSHAPLKEAYTRILRDEARHHGAGLILTRGQQLTVEQSDELFYYSRKFIHSLKSAPRLLATIEEAANGMTDREKTAFWEETNFYPLLAKRMQRMKEMLLKVDQVGLVERLEADGCFKV